MTSPSKHRSPFFRAIVCLVNFAGVVASGGCQRAGDWNAVFHRSQGWQYADGGSSAELSNGRRVWLFGDSWIRHDPALVYNTIAVQNTDSDRAPTPDEIRFFARDANGRVLDVSHAGLDGMRAWLEPARDGRNTWLWPTDAIVAGGKLIAFYSEVGCVHGEFPACRSYMGNMGFVGHTAFIVDNPTDEPEKWKIVTAPLRDRRGQSPSDHRLHWGSALLEERGWLYIFGTDLGPESGPRDVKLARVMPRDVQRYDLWQFSTPQGWRMFPTGPMPTDLQTVARGGATELSVDRIVRDGQSWLVMVQVDPFAHEVVIRSSPAGAVESVRWAGPEAGTSVRRLSLPALDPASKNGMNWAGRAQRRQSHRNDSLFVSYFSSRAASLRFVEIPLSQAL